MSTKVHDDDDDDNATFDEVDVILENAKAGLQLKRSLERKSRRNINLSDIPENFAHVPASSCKNNSCCEYNSIARPPPTPPPLPLPPHPNINMKEPGGSNLNCKQRRNFGQAIWRWFRDRFVVCVHAVEYGTHCDMCGCSVVASVHVPSRKACYRN